MVGPRRTDRRPQGPQRGRRLRPVTVHRPGRALAVQRAGIARTGGGRLTPDDSDATSGPGRSFPGQPGPGGGAHLGHPRPTGPRGATALGGGGGRPTALGACRRSARRRPHGGLLRPLGAGRAGGRLRRWRSWADWFPSPNGRVRQRLPPLRLWRQSGSSTGGGLTPPVPRVRGRRHAGNPTLRAGPWRMSRWQLGESTWFLSDLVGANGTTGWSASQAGVRRGRLRRARVRGAA